MKILQLKTQGFRNLSDVDIQFNPQFNLFSGLNGSGKTSILESIYLFGFGRSFRASQLSTLIHHESEQFTNFVQIKEPDEVIQHIGLEKNRQARLKIKVNGEKAGNITEIVRSFPMQILCPSSFDLLTAGPQWRRQFLDWGVFHVEPAFIKVWSQYHRALRQRNILLRDKPVQLSQLEAWEGELIKWGELLTHYRTDYIKAWLPEFIKKLSLLLPLENLELNYYQGWEEGSLKEALHQSLGSDLKLGYTRVGPHRFDIVFKLYNKLASQILSRGQQKVFICALMLAQEALILEKLKKPCLYLIDDLASELDKNTRNRVIEQMALSGSQVFITGIEAEFLKEGIQDFDHKMFHVKHGLVSELI